MAYPLFLSPIIYLEVLESCSGIVTSLFVTTESRSNLEMFGSEVGDLFEFVVEQQDSDGQTKYVPYPSLIDESHKFAASGSSWRGEMSQATGA